MTHFKRVQNVREEVSEIQDTLLTIGDRVNVAFGTTPYPFTDEETTYLCILRKRILEQEEIMITVHSQSQESFWGTIALKYQKPDEAEIVEDGRSYEDALLNGLLTALLIIQGRIARTQLHKRQ